MIRALLLGFFQVGLILVIAPFFEGVARKVTARIQSRQGPPLLQPYFDLAKLLGKEDIEAGEIPGMQRFAALLSLAAILTVSWLVPMGGGAPMDNHGDVLMLIYLLTLCGISTLLAGLAAGSTYSLVGMSREMMAMMTLEPLLAVSIAAGALHAGSLRPDAVLSASVYSHAGFPLSGLLLLGVMLFAFQAFVGRMPFDTAEAETEIMEGALIEYSGPKLALFKLARAVKLVVYAALVIALFVPATRVGFYPADVLVFLLKVLVLVLLVTVIAATHARYRIDQAIRYYMLLFVVSLVALAVATYGY